MTSVTPVGDAIIKARMRYEMSQAKAKATHIVIGRLTYDRLRQEFYATTGMTMPPYNSGPNCELMGMLFSFINYDNYLSVR